MSKRWKGIPSVMKAKKVFKKKNGSSTPGRNKGLNCQASATERSMARRSRSYREAEYETWCLAADQANRSGSSQKTK